MSLISDDKNTVKNADKTTITMAIIRMILEFGEP